MIPARWSLATRRTAAARVSRDPGRCEPVLADADHHQQAQLGVLTEADADVHAVDEQIGVAVDSQRAGAERGVLGLPLLGQPLDRARLRPEASAPSRSSTAGPKPPVESPCRYRVGITSVTFGDRGA
jgi:hypothetical protein